MGPFPLKPWRPPGARDDSSHPREGQGFRAARAAGGAAADRVHGMAQVDRRFRALLGIAQQREHLGAAQARTQFEQQGKRAAHVCSRERAARGEVVATAGLEREDVATRRADRVGRRPVMVWPQLATLLLTYPIFLWIVDTRSAMSLLGGFGFLSLIGSIPYSAFYVALTEGLPQNIRGGTLATVYAVAIAAFGGTAQLVVTWLLHITGNALAPAWYMLLASAIGLAAMAMMRETLPASRS